MTNQKITITLEGQGFDKVKAQFGDLSESGNRFGKALGDIGKIATGFIAANVIQNGFSKITSAIGDSVSAARESIQVNAQLDAVLKSTGGAAGVTAEAAQNLASSLEKASLFEDEAVLNGENLLLTFTNIGKDVFPTATQAMVDMSQALGQDMKSSAIQLGKALNDPIEGVTALRRVGVSFTEAQMKQIEAMQKAGDIAGAQRLILAELNKEFGGSAKAASDAAGSAEKYRDRVNQLKEDIGKKLLPIQEKLNEVKLAFINLLAQKLLPLMSDAAKAFEAVGKVIKDILLEPAKELVDLFRLGFAGGEIGGEFTTIERAAFGLGQVLRNDILPVIREIEEGFRLFILVLKGGEVGGELSTIQQAFVDIAEAIKPVVDAFGDFFKAIGLDKQTLVTALAVVIGTVLVAAIAALAIAIGGMIISLVAAAAPFIAIGVAIAALVITIKLLIENFDAIKVKANEIFSGLPGPIQAAMQFIADDIIAKINGIIQIFEGLWQVIRGVVDLIIALVHGDWAAAWQALQDIATGAVEAFIGLIETMFGDLPNKLINLVGEFMDAGAQLAQGLIDGIRNALSNFKISINIGGVDLGPLGSTPEVHVTIYPFSFEVGTPFVPTDMLAFLHRGEAVIPAAMNPFNGGGGLGNGLQVAININTLRAYNEGEGRQLASTLAYNTISALQLRGVSI